MSAGQTVKTTVRIAEELHWQFQAERAKWRLTNERAVGEALAFWIANPAAALPAEPSAAQRSVSARERKYVDAMIRILRDRNHPVTASALAAVLEALLDGRPRRMKTRTWTAPRSRAQSGLI